MLHKLSNAISRYRPSVILRTAKCEGRGSAHVIPGSKEVAVLYVVLYYWQKLSTSKTAANFSIQFEFMIGSVIS